MKGCIRERMYKRKDVYEEGCKRERIKSTKDLKIKDEIMYKRVCKLDRIQKRKGEKERKERGKDV